MKSLASTVRIGGASGFWGDSSVGATQLVRQGEIDFLVFDYLAELTMSILAGARLRNPELGYATDFVDITMKTLLPELVEKGIRVVSNAGGMNPMGCAQALQAVAQAQGIALRVAVVQGDEVMPALPRLRAQGVVDLQQGQVLPEHLLSANAYLGALPIRQALDAGAQVVITGRCVDSAVTLGVLMHVFDWQAHDHDLLAQGSLAGHIIECGCQATGGLHTDWHQVPDWPHIGYPVLECEADGAFVVTKPTGTGGLVNCATVGEQILYEIGDPSAYVLPDVVCDFTQVQLEWLAEHRVRVTGARGRPPTDTYKVSATYLNGYRCNADLIIIGVDAVAKAHRTAQAILVRTRELLAQQGHADFSRTQVEVIGAENAFGPHAQTLHAREVVMRLVVTHESKAALECFAREIAPAGTSWAPGTAGALTQGRPRPTPLIRQCTFLLPKDQLVVTCTLDGLSQTVAIPLGQAPSPLPLALSSSQAPDAVTQVPDTQSTLHSGTHELPLMHLAYARSGDKADVANIGVIARDPKDLPLLRAQLTPQRVAQWLGHWVKGPVRRYELPGLAAMNFVCETALDGGGMTSLRSDPLGKSMAQILLTMPIRVARG